MGCFASSPPKFDGIETVFRPDESPAIADPNHKYAFPIAENYTESTPGFDGTSHKWTPEECSILLLVFELFLAPINGPNGTAAAAMHDTVFTRSPHGEAPDLNARYADVLSDAATSQAPARFVLANANRLEAEFFIAVYPRLKDLLLPHRMQLIADDKKSGRFVLLNLERPHTETVAPTLPNVSNWQLAQIAVRLTKYVNRRGRFDYVSAVEEITRRTLVVLRRWVETRNAAAKQKAQSDAATAPSKSDEKDGAAAGGGDAVSRQLDVAVLAGIKPVPVAFQGGEMASYEVDFQAASRSLLYPNANYFHTAHFNWINTAKLDRPYASYYLDTLSFPEHELMHCIQMELKQTDAGGWALEHDASRVAFVIMGLLAEEERVTAAAVAASTAVSSGARLFPAGKLEEIALYTYKLVRTIQASHCGPPPTGQLDAKSAPVPHASDGGSVQPNPAHYLGYQKWRASFGVTPPCDKDSFTVAVTDESGDWFKYRLSLEMYCQIRDARGSAAAAAADAKSEAAATPTANEWFNATYQLLETMFGGERANKALTPDTAPKANANAAAAVAAPVSIPPACEIAPNNSLEYIDRTPFGAAAVATALAQLKI